MQTITIVGFIIDKDKDKEKEKDREVTISGAEEIIAWLRSSILDTYQRQELRGMKMLLRDFKEMVDNMDEEEKLEFRKIFQSRTLECSI